MYLNLKAVLSGPPSVIVAVVLLLMTGLKAGAAEDTTAPATQPAAPHFGTPPASSVPPPPLPTDRSYINDTSTHYDPSIVPQRPKPIIEIGNPFFGSGLIKEGTVLPTGQVISPTFIVFGTYQSVFQAFDNPATDPGGLEHKPRTEWANRLDLYGDLYLTGTERLVVGIRPLDNGEFARPGQARYTGVQFSPSDGAAGQSTGWEDRVNARITTLFFEGDFGQIFPELDPFDSKQLDIGFSVGRQPFNYQNGLLINDDMDAIGITQNDLRVPNGTNLQLTAVYAWNQITNNDGIDRGDPGLLGFFANADIGHTTWNFDTAYVFGNSQRGNGNAIYAGLSATQQIGHFNTSFHVLGSKALFSNPPLGDSAYSTFGNGSTAVGSGILLFSSVSWTPPFTHDVVYVDSYLGIDRFTSAAHGPDRGGPLGSVGILFAEQPIGRYASALSSDPDRSIGVAVGYQKFLDESQRREIIFEVGGRAATDGALTSALAAGARYQQAFGQHWVLQLDTFVSLNDGSGVGYGGRVAVILSF